MKEAKFAMAFHCYQPVFNFDWEIEKAYESAYLPLLKILDEFPGVKVSFHFSGNMLEWFELRHPEYLDIIRKMVRRGQMELIGGGCFEPIMVLIPERDREGQIRMNEAIIFRLFGIRPRGVWIAERVWEPALTGTLNAVGAKYTIVDDYHILRTGIEKEEVFKPYITRGENGSTILFPSSTRLRYTMPFNPPKVTIDYIKNITDKNHDNKTCVFYADDGEKFGAWPYTNQLVYKREWLRKFLTLLEENSDWLRTETYSGIMDDVSPKEIDEVPESSYAEMTKWSGGNFKNFRKKYPEADRMCERMLHISNMIEEVKSSRIYPYLRGYVREAKESLFKAQSNCAYWHGAFGGLYLPHLRSGVYSYLIKAKNVIENAIEKVDKRIWAVEHDLEHNGEMDKIDCPTLGFKKLKEETIIGNKYVDIFIKPVQGGSVTEIDNKVVSVNLINTMSRVKEDYHKKLKRSYLQRIKLARKAVVTGYLADIHDVLGVGERGLRKILFYDDYQRGSFLTHIFEDKKSWKDMYRERTSYDNFLKDGYESFTEADNGVISCILSKRDQVFDCNKNLLDLEVVKKVSIGSKSEIIFSHKIRKHSESPVSLGYAMEHNFLIWDETSRVKPIVTRADRFLLKDMYSGASLDFSLNKEFDILKYPVYTVNETETGLKKTFQGIAVVISDECVLDDCNKMCEAEVKVRINA